MFLGLFVRLENLFETTIHSFEIFIAVPLLSEKSCVKKKKTPYNINTSSDKRKRELLRVSIEFVRVILKLKKKKKVAGIHVIIIIAREGIYGQTSGTS